MRNFDCSGLLGTMYKKADGPQQSPQQQALYSAASMAKPPGAPPLPKPVEGGDPASDALAQQEAEQAEQKMEIEKQKQEAAHRKEVADRDKTIADLRDKLQNANFEAQLARQQMELFKQRQAEIDKIKAEQEKLNTRRDSMAGEEAEHKSRMAEAVADAKANIAEEKAKATEESANSNAQAYVKMTEDARKHNDEMFSGIRDEIAGQKEELLKQREDFMLQREHEAEERMKKMQEGNKVSPYLMKSLQDAASSARNIAKLNSNMIAKSDNLFASDLGKSAAVTAMGTTQNSAQPQQQTQQQQQPQQQQSADRSPYRDSLTTHYGNRVRNDDMNRLRNMYASNSARADEQGKAYHNIRGVIRDSADSSGYMKQMLSQLGADSRESYANARRNAANAKVGSDEWIAGANDKALALTGVYDKMDQGLSGALARQRAEADKGLFRSLWDATVDTFTLARPRELWGNVGKSGQLAELYGGKQNAWGADGFANDRVRQAYEDMINASGYSQGYMTGYAKSIPATVSDLANIGLTFIPGVGWAARGVSMGTRLASGAGMMAGYTGLGMLDDYLNPAGSGYDTSYTTNAGINPSAYNPVMANEVADYVSNGGMVKPAAASTEALSENTARPVDAAVPPKRGNDLTASNVNSGYNLDTAQGWNSYMADKNSINGLIRLVNGFLPMLGLNVNSVQYNPSSSGKINPVHSAVALHGINAAVNGEPSPGPRYDGRQNGYYTPADTQRNWYMAARNEQFGNMYGSGKIHSMVDSMRGVTPNF